MGAPLDPHQSLRERAGAPHPWGGLAVRAAGRDRVRGRVGDGDPYPPAAERFSQAMAGGFDGAGENARGLAAPSVQAGAETPPGPEVVVVDSGVGNIPNAVRGLQRAGGRVRRTTDPAVVAAARCLVLPGVGAFPAAMARLREGGLVAALRAAAEAGAAVLGICLGHQLLFEESEEFGRTEGLGLLPGRVALLPAGVRRPHMGWSRLAPLRPDPLLAGLEGGAWMYFVHSFAAHPDPGDLVATTDAGGAPVCAVVRRGRICGAQFHPEKSGAAGARLLANFLALARQACMGGEGR